MIDPEILQKLNPAPDVLVNALIELVDDTMLREIAAADYDIGTEEYLVQLHRIRDNHEFLVAMSWSPREVLDLTRWNEYKAEDADSVEQYRRSHIIRAFACAVLLRANAELLRMNTDPLSQDTEEAENETLAQLLTSLPVLGHPFQVAAQRFMAWRVQDLTRSYEAGPFFVLALLLLVLQTQTDLTAVEMQEIIDNLYALESQTRQELTLLRMQPAHFEHWLLGLTSFKQRHEIWKQIGKEIATLAVNYKDSGIAHALLNISGRLADKPQSKWIIG